MVEERTCIFLRWFFEYYIEILATLTGLIYLIYSVRGDILLWVFGIITSALYVYVFFKSGIYADMGINIYYVIISIYGWFHWSVSRGNLKQTLPYSRLSMKLALKLTWIMLLLFIVITYILVKYTDSNIPAWDAFTTSASIIATWMLARKIIEHWLIWIVVDAISVGLFIYKGLYPTILLFIVYTGFAIIGYFDWRKEWKKQSLQSAL